MFLLSGKGNNSFNIKDNFWPSLSIFVCNLIVTSYFDSLNLLEFEEAGQIIILSFISVVAKIIHNSVGYIESIRTINVFMIYMRYTFFLFSEILIIWSRYIPRKKGRAKMSASQHRSRGFEPYMTMIPHMTQELVSSWTG